HFVRPPIAKSGSAHSRGGQFIGNFVSFENVLESADFEAELFRNAEEHQDFILAVAVRVNVALAFQHFDKRLEAQIAARRNEIFFTGGEALVVVLPRFLVVAGFAKCAANGLFDAQARGRIPPGLTRDTEVRTLGIFAECQLDAGKSSFERKLRSRLAPAKLDDQRLSADGIGGTVKNVRSRDSAC